LRCGCPVSACPFVHDQDVQRIFTARLPLLEMLSFVSRTERHPPLYFLVLHVVEYFSQSEAAVRLPRL